MEVNVKIKSIETIHTNVGSRLDQPMINVVLEVNKVGSDDKYEITFSEMLSNMSGKTDAELNDFVTNMVTSYVKTAYKGQQELAGDKEWKKQKTYIGKQFVITVA